MASFQGNAASVPPLKISYVTDIEGNFDFFERFVNSSPALYFSPCSGNSCYKSTESTLILNDGYGFVFGGDLYDKGPYDIRLTKLLCDLKEKYPDRVWLLMGNRDINKLRLSSELSTPGELQRLHDDPPFWDPSVPGLASWLNHFNLPHTLSNRLKWILECTMGAPDTFEYRRRELYELKLVTASSSSQCDDGCKSLQHEVQHDASHYMNEVSDEDVLESFVESVKPDGFVIRFLKLAQLALRIGDTVFVHGAITSKGLLFVPSDETRHRHIWLQPPPGIHLPLSTSIDDWFSQLNAFKDRSLQDFLARPYWEGQGGGNHALLVDPSSRTPDGRPPHYDWLRRKGGEALLAHQSFAASSGHNLCVETYCKYDDQSFKHVKNLDLKVISYLKYVSINKVIVGHKPIGTIPFVIKYDMNEPEGRGGVWEGYEKEIKRCFPSPQTLPSSYDGVNGGGGGGGMVTSSVPNEYLEVICCDTSYSDPTSRDMRGHAAFSLNLEFSPLASSSSTFKQASDDHRPLLVCQASILGTLPNREIISGSLNHVLIGKCTKEGWWVVTQQTTDSSINSSNQQQSLNGLMNAMRMEEDTLITSSHRQEEAAQSSKKLSHIGQFLICRTVGRSVDIRWADEDALYLEFGEKKRTLQTS